MRILIVEDDKDLALFYSAVMDFQGFNCDVAHNIREGTRLLEAGQYDLVLSDNRLPDGFGMELLEKYRRKMPDALFALITGDRDIVDDADILHGVADTAVLKPIECDDLIDLTEMVDAFRKRKKSA